jgi:hypothetical protein
MEVILTHVFTQLHDAHPPIDSHDVGYGPGLPSRSNCLFWKTGDEAHRTAQKGTTREDHEAMRFDIMAIDLLGIRGPMGDEKNLRRSSGKSPDVGRSFSMSDIRNIREESITSMNECL